MAACAAVALIAPASAWACDEPHGSPDAVTAGPGDEVGFVIPTTLPGAKYELTIEGDEVASGEDATDEAGVSGEFTVPDLGSESRRVPVVVHVTHESDSADWRWEMPLDYRGAEPAPSPPTAEPSSTPASQRPAPASTPAAPPAPPGPGPDNPAPTLLPPSTPSSGAPPATGGAGPSPDDGEPSPVGAVLGAVLPGLADSSGRPRRTSLRDRRRAERRARRARRKANSFAPGRDPDAVKGRTVEAPRDPRMDLSDDRFAGLGYSIAWRLLAAVAIAGLLAPLLLGGLARRRRRREAEVEAELQEIVSEEHARQAASR
jgi:type II secretory pathway pseudopilin PulG